MGIQVTGVMGTSKHIQVFKSNNKNTTNQTKTPADNSVSIQNKEKTKKKQLWKKISSIALVVALVTDIIVEHQFMVEEKVKRESLEKEKELADKMRQDAEEMAKKLEEEIKQKEDALKKVNKGGKNNSNGGSGVPPIL